MFWNANLFDGQVIYANLYALTIKFVSLLTDQSFHLLNVYGPSSPVEKASFVHCLYNVDVSGYEEWALVGDFNFIRGLENRNKPGGSISDMMVFHDLIQHLDLVNIPFEGVQYTWSNMQDDPLLEKLD